MAYRLKPATETVEDGIRRISATQFETIARIIADTRQPDARRVHETRRCLKRLRSLLKLVAPACPEAARHDSGLRDIARSLSALRDRGALLETLDGLTPAPGPAPQLGSWLATAGETGPAPDTAGEILHRLAPRIARSARHISRLQLDSEGIGALSPGLRHGYRRLRQGFRIALESGEEDDIHHWRKCTKVHWHHSLLFRQACPGALDMHARMAGELGDHLGDWRDAGLLIEALRQAPEAVLPGEQMKLLRRQAMRKQKAALKKAIRLSAWLTAEKPSALAARWQSYWQTAGGA